MSDEPDDLMDQSGRMRRIVAALVVGAVCGAIAYLVCWQLSEPDTLPDTLMRNSGRSGAYRFVFYATGLAFALGLSATLVILNARAAKRWRERRVPQAKQIS
jgi:bacteriorhodopsin